MRFIIGTLFALASISFAAFPSVKGDEYSVGDVDSSDTSDTLAYTLHIPAPVRGRITAHLPLMLFVVDSAGGQATWIPAGEFGFVITPTMTFEDLVLEFPVSLQTIPPFLDKTAAFGDIMLGAFLRSSKGLGIGMDYRFAKGRYIPSGLTFWGHIWSIDLGIPYRALRLKGVRIEWLVSGVADFAPGFQQGTRPIDRYDGTGIMIVPYWSFDLPYGTLDIQFRSLIYSHFTGIVNSTGKLYTAQQENLSELEVRYTYP